MGKAQLVQMLQRSCDLFSEEWQQDKVYPRYYFDFYSMPSYFFILFCYT